MLHDPDPHVPRHYKPRAIERRARGAIDAEEAIIGAVGAHVDAASEEPHGAVGRSERALHAPKHAVEHRGGRLFKMGGRHEVGHDVDERVARGHRRI